MVTPERTRDSCASVLYKFAIYITLHYLSTLQSFSCFVLGSISWTHMTNTAAENGLFYGFMTESACMSACVRLPSCAAIALGPAGCLLHSVTDLTTTYYATGVTLFILCRNCQSPSQLTSYSPLTAIISEAVTAGMYLKDISFFVPH